MITVNFPFLRDPNSRVYILVLFQRSTGAPAIRGIFSGRIQRTLSEVLEEESPTLTISDLKEHNILVPEDAKVFLMDVDHGTIIALDSLSRYNDEDNSARSTSLLRKEYLKEELRERKLDLAYFQALKKIRDRAEEFKSSKGIPNDKKIEDLNKIASHDVEIFDAFTRGTELEEFIQQKAQALQKKGEIFSHRPKQEKAVQTPDLHEIAPWKSKEKSGPASKYLQDNYGHLLKRYNRELDRDLICLQDIKVHDKTLWQGLYNEAKKTGTKPSEYVASKPQRTKEAALDTDIGKLRKLEREAARQRQAMRRHGISLESLKNKP